MQLLPVATALKIDPGLLPECVPLCCYRSSDVAIHTRCFCGKCAPRLGCANFSLQRHELFDLCLCCRRRHLVVLVRCRRLQVGLPAVFDDVCSPAAAPLELQCRIQCRAHAVTDIYLGYSERLHLASESNWSANATRQVDAAAT